MECWQRLNFIIKGQQDIGKENIPDYAGAKELFLPVTGTEGTVMSLIVHLHLRIAAAPYGTAQTGF